MTILRPVLRQAADEIVAAFDSGESEAPEGMLAAELAVHTWDLATALGRDTNELDPALAEAGYAFMSESLTDERRGDAFNPEQPAPEGANAYERIAAFAGRSVGTDLRGWSSWRREAGCAWRHHRSRPEPRTCPAG